MDSKLNILIVEDERSASSLIAAALSASGYGVLCAENGKKAISAIALNNFNLILLDLGLPDIDGMKVLKSLREWSDIPVIIVSAVLDECVKVEALDSGAVDYITKPFSVNELLARIRAAVRLQKRICSDSFDFNSNYSSYGLVIDYAKRKVTKNNTVVHLTPIEYNIVALLSHNAGKVLSHEYIIRQIWGPFEGDSQVLRVNMANIRRKLEDNPASPQLILTEIRIGYKMVEPEIIHT